MRATFAKTIAFSLTAAFFSCGAAVAKSDSTPSLQDRQQAACYDDVKRLCGNTLPDAAKAAECMKDKRPQVSAKCSALWDVKE